MARKRPTTAPAFAPDQSPGHAPLHTQIRRHLIGLIKSLHINDPLPPERLLAEQFGTSRLTVHKVMATLQNEGLVIRRKGKGTFVACCEGVVRNDLASPGAECVLVCYPNWFSYDIFQKVSLATELGIKEGLEVFDYKLSPTSRYELLCEKVRERGGVRGIILIPPGGRLTRGDVRVLDQAGVPVVSLIYTEYAALSARLSCVVKDQFAAGYLLMERLLQLGHRRVGYVANEPTGEDLARFTQGLKAALRDEGQKPEVLRCCEGGAELWKESMEACFQQTGAMLKRERPTALLYDSVPGAMGGLSALASAQVRIPHDLSVAVNDEYGLYSAYTVPPLSVIRCDIPQMLRKALQIILGATSPTRENTLIGVSLLDRGSLAPAPGDATAPGRLARRSQR